MSRRSLVLLLLLSAFWGASYLFIKVALEDGVSPWAIVSIRTALAALVLVPLAAQRGVLGSIRERFGPIVVLAFVQVVVPLTLIGLGEERDLLVAHRDPRGHRADLHVPARLRPHR